MAELCVGITPMLQIIRQIFKDPQDSTSVSLIFANQASQAYIVHSSSVQGCHMALKVLEKNVIFSGPEKSLKTRALKVLEF